MNESKYILINKLSLFKSFELAGVGDKKFTFRFLCDTDDAST